MWRGSQLATGSCEEPGGSCFGLGKGWCVHSKKVLGSDGFFWGYHAHALHSGVLEYLQGLPVVHTCAHMRSHALVCARKLTCGMRWPRPGSLLVALTAVVSFYQLGHYS